MSREPEDLLEARPALSPAQAMLLEVASMRKHAMTAFESGLWQEVIDSFGDDAVMTALRAHLFGPRCAFMPQPGEISQQLSPAGGADFAALELVRAVATIGPYSVPKFADPAIAAAVVYMGGWAQVCNDLPAPAERFDHDAYKKRFATVYAEVAGKIRRGLLVAPQLRSVHMIHNERRAEVLGLEAGSASRAPALADASGEVSDAYARESASRPSRGGQRP